MSVYEKREKLTILERLLLDITDKIKTMENDNNADPKTLDTAYAMRDKCKTDINKIRDELGY